MCGICGIVYFDSTRPVTRQDLLQMSSTLAHEVPMARGYGWTAMWGWPIVGWRSSICALWRAQPMSNEDGIDLDHLQWGDLQLPRTAC